MSDKDKRPQGSSPVRATGGTGTSTASGGPGNAALATQLEQAKSATILMPLGGTLALPDVAQLPAAGPDVAGGGDTLSEYHAWQAALKALRGFEDQHKGDLFSYGRPEDMKERYALENAVTQTFNAMSPQEQQIIYESEMRFAEWKKEFDAKCEADEQERRRVWMYEYAGLDPDKRVDAATLNEAFERAKSDKARESLHQSITAIPNMIGEEMKGVANSLYAAGHATETGNEGWLGGAAKSLWNLGVDGVHMAGHVGGSTVETAGEMAGGATVMAADPGGSLDRYVEETEASRKNIRQTLTDGSGGGGLLTEAHAAVLAYTPGVKDIGEGFSNTSLESPEQTEAWKNRSATDRVVQSSAGISSFAGTLAGVGGAASKAKAFVKPKSVKAPVPVTPDAPSPVKAPVKKGGGPDSQVAGASARAAAPDARAGRFWEADDFMGGKMDDASSTAIRNELQDEISAMNLTPDELAARGMDRGLTGLNNAPDEWLPKYKKGQTNTEAYADLWARPSPQIPATLLRLPRRSWTNIAGE